MAVNSTKDVPFHAAQSFRWWRLAVYVYLPALILTVVSSLLKWDATVAEAAKANNIEVSAAQTSLAVSFAFAIIAQTATAIACWWLAAKLLEGSTAARTVLSVAAAVFVINAAMTLVGAVSQVRAGTSTALGLITAGLLIVASIIAATATAQAYRGERNQKFFVTT
ncbi:hypothetical protein [uncultured Corynebacterium sp.]|uniref:hypothetical protein n=1 Tax=uncultured Corynebacterium sp. TaxID=159447 RepID=UPI00262C610B|nr:hypothetical protein [uncultured Corynebacterium sp.]